MSEVKHLSMQELEAGLEEIRRSPKVRGVLEMIVRRPETEQREVLQEGQLDTELGLVGDNWKARGSRMTDDGAAHPEMQINIMNCRTIALIAGEKERWQWAGDQLFVDLDLSEENLPPGTRLSIGDAILEVTAVPHTGCHKFVDRFGRDAMLFVNSEVGKQLHLRGINAVVIQPGTIRMGDAVSKIG